MRSRSFSMVILLVATLAAAAADPLPSWNDGKSKQAILKFVAKVTKDGSPDFVPVSERIATFDNDGTLWCEHPLPVQLSFALDRVKTLAPQHPDWKTKQPFQAAIEGDHRALAESGERGLLELMMASHAGMTTDEFEKIVTNWLATAKHPRLKRPYTECVYQPMLELLAWLRANGFKTFIVSGGGIDFMRPWAEKVYGIPPEQVVGSSGKVKFELRDGQPVLVSCLSLISSTTRLASPLVFTGLSAGVPLPRSAIRMAISRCWSGRPRRKGLAWG